MPQARPSRNYWQARKIRGATQAIARIFSGGVSAEAERGFIPQPKKFLEEFLKKSTPGSPPVVPAPGARFPRVDVNVADVTFLRRVCDI